MSHWQRVRHKLAKLHHLKRSAMISNHLTGFFPKDTTTSLQTSSKIPDQKNKSIYRRWSYPLCDYKPNQISWTSEPGPIMDDITFCRNMLNLVWTLERSGGVLVTMLDHLWPDVTTGDHVWPMSMDGQTMYEMLVHTICVTRSPFPPSLAPVLLSVPFGHCWLNSLGSGNGSLGVERFSGGQVGSLPRSSLENFPNLKTSWWSSQLTFLALGRLDSFKPPLGVFTPEKNTF